VGGSDIRRHRSLDFVRHTFDIPDHIVIPKAQNFDPCSRKSASRAASTRCPEAVLCWPPSTSITSRAE
jgi:hypothetical protein